MPAGQLGEYGRERVAGLLGGHVAVLLQLELSDDRRDALAAESTCRCSMPTMVLITLSIRSVTSVSTADGEAPS